MLFETHAHPYITFKKSGETLLQNFFAGGGKYLISIGCDIESSLKSIELSKKYQGIFATIGFHPCDIPLGSDIEKEIEKLRQLYFSEKQEIVALGEIGLDYYHLESSSQKNGYARENIIAQQKEFFRKQIALAKELSLPFVIHSRDANEDVLEILKEHDAKNFVFHCYSGDWDFAQKILSHDSSAMFGFGGVLTFKKSLELQAVAKKLPLKNILIETDAPFLTPEPLRGREENEPLFTKYILDYLQDLRDESSEEIEKTIFENSCRFYGITAGEKI